MIPWSNIVTGTVGLAGIGGTLWQGKRSREASSKDLNHSLEVGAANLITSINADNERARIAEKRRIYASFIATLGGLLKTWNQVNTIPRAEALVGSLAAAAELRLIAPGDLGVKAETVLTIAAASGQIHEKFGILRLLLIYSMRADLGEASPLSPEQEQVFKEYSQSTLAAMSSPANNDQDKS